MVTKIYKTFGQKLKAAEIHSKKNLVDTIFKNYVNCIHLTEMSKVHIYFAFT